MNTKILACFTAFMALASAGCDFSRNFCCLTGLTCPSYGGFAVDNQVISVGDFNVASFGDLTLNHGDVEGRVAVRNNFYGTNGVSLGDLLNDSYTYSFIAGGSIQISGSAKFTPDSQKIFSGSSSFSVPSDVSSRVFVGCNSTGCLNSAFDGLKSYWTQFSTLVASQSPNVAIQISESGVATITCQSSSSKVYYVQVSASNFGGITSYQSSGCDGSASIVVNVVGDEDIYFRGDTLNSTAAYVIYNIASTSNVYIDTSVYGNIVAPNSNVNVIKGTVYGHLIANNITNLVQVNTIVSSGPCQVTSNPDGTCINSGSLTTGFAPLTTGSVPSAPLTTGSAPSAPITTGSTPSVPSTTGSAPSIPVTTGSAPSTPITTGVASGGDSAVNTGNGQTSQCVCPGNSALMTSVSVFAAILAIALI